MGLELAATRLGLVQVVKFLSRYENKNRPRERPMRFA
jgi:hypothetical protein